MAIRKGDIAKENVTNVITEVFGNMFVGIQDKKIYLNVPDGNESVQLALSITLVKNPIAAAEVSSAEGHDWSTPSTSTPADLTPFDRAKVEELKEKLKKLGMID